MWTDRSKRLELRLREAGTGKRPLRFAEPKPGNTPAMKFPPLVVVEPKRKGRRPLVWSLFYGCLCEVGDDGKVIPPSPPSAPRVVIHPPEIG
jgi:hypothetical protein